MKLRTFDPETARRRSEHILISHLVQRKLAAAFVKVEHLPKTRTGISLCTAVILGFGYGVRFDLIGQLRLDEVFGGVLLLFLLMFGKLWWSRITKKFIVLLLIHSLFILFSSTLNDRELEYTLRGLGIGLSSVVLLLTAAFVFRAGASVVAAFWVAQGVGSVWIWRLHPEFVWLSWELLVSGSNLFKTFYNHLFISLWIAALVYLSSRGRTLVNIAVLIVGCVVAALAGARNLMIIFLISLPAAWCFAYAARQKWSTRITVLVLSLMVGSTAGLAYVVYGLLFETGIVRSQNEARVQDLIGDNRNLATYLLLNRGEAFSWLAIPPHELVIGKGAWAVDESKSILPELERLGMVVRDMEWIPAHSVLFGSLVWGGLGAFICMVALAWVFTDTVVATARERVCLRCVLALMFGAVIWTLMFSPIGHLRTDLPYYLAFVSAVGVRGTLPSRKLIGPRLRYVSATQGCAGHKEVRP